MPSEPSQRRKVGRRRASLRSKLLVLGLVASAAALSSYLGHIPRTVDLPQTDLDAQPVAKADSGRIEIDEPAVSEGGLLLSYAGRAGEVADLHFDQAIVNSSNAGLQASLRAVRPLPARIAYVSLPVATRSPQIASPAANGDTCHTFVEVRRAKGSPPISALNLFLLNGTTDNEQRREIRVWTEGGDLEVQIHTDPPPLPEGSRTPLDAFPGCRKTLQVRPLDDQDPAGLVDAPLLPAPVSLTVPPGKDRSASNPANSFRIQLTPAFAAPLMWLSATDMFREISLGDPSLECKRLRVLPLHAQTGEHLKIRAAGKSNLVLDQLTFSLTDVRLEVSGRSWVEIDGKPVGRNLMRALKENIILAGVLSAITTAILLRFNETFFPRVEVEPEGENES